MTRTTLPLIVLLGLAWLVAPADVDGQKGDSLKPGGHRSTYSAESSYSLEADISRGARKLGEMDSRHRGLSYAYSWQQSERHGWDIGASVQHFGFDVSGRAPIPEDLTSISLRLADRWKLSERWSMRFEVHPGIHSDFEDISGGDFNAPIAHGFSFNQNTNLQWHFGLAVNFRAKYPVLGGVGLRWRFADRWHLLLTAPKARIDYSFDERLTLFAGGDVKGGTFRVSKNFGRKAGQTELNDSDVDYREIRVGSGARYLFNDHIALGAEVGWMIDRRFEFDDENVLLNGDGAPYFRLSIGGSF